MRCTNQRADEDASGGIDSANYGLRYRGAVADRRRAILSPSPLVCAYIYVVPRRHACRASGRPRSGSRLCRHGRSSGEVIAA